MPLSSSKCGEGRLGVCLNLCVSVCSAVTKRNANAALVFQVAFFSEFCVCVGGRGRGEIGRGLPMQLFSSKWEGVESTLLAKNTSVDNSKTNKVEIPLLSFFSLCPIPPPPRGF